MKSEIWLSWVSCGVCVPVSLRPGSGCPRSGNFLKVGGYSMLPCLASQGFPYVEKIAKLPGRGCYRCWGTNTAKISAKSTYSDWSMNPIHAIFIPPLRQLKSFAIFSYVAVCLPQALLLASLRLRDCLWSQRKWCSSLPQYGLACGRSGIGGVLWSSDVFSVVSTGSAVR